MALLRYHYVVALNAHLYAKPAEGLGYDAEVAQRHVFYAHAVAGHGGHADERAHLNHVGQYVVDCSVQPVGADALYMVVVPRAKTAAMMMLAVPVT